MGAGFSCGNVDNREKNNEIDDIIRNIHNKLRTNHNSPFLE